MLQQSSVCLSLGNVRTEAVRLDHGVLAPQGAPESLFLFILVTGDDVGIPARILGQARLRTSHLWSLAARRVLR